MARKGSETVPGIARYLGYPVKLYDGSYQDWQQRKLPVKAGATP